MKPLPRYEAYVRERSTTNWENYIAALREAGRAVDVESVDRRGKAVRVVLDGESMFRRRFVCDTRTCAPTRNAATGLPWRESGMKSCCADLVVDLAPIEVRGLERHWPAIRDYLAARDPFFTDLAARDCLELSSDFELSLRKRAGRCIFAVRDREWGIRCGIHSACVAKDIPLREAKPVVCDTFPLLVMDLPGDLWYVGAHDADVSGIAALGDDPIEAYPCLKNHRTGEPMYRAMEETIRAYFGDDVFALLEPAATRYLAGPRPRKMKLP